MIVYAEQMLLEGENALIPTSIEFGKSMEQAPTVELVGFTGLPLNDGSTIVIALTSS